MIADSEATQKHLLRQLICNLFKTDSQLTLNQLVSGSAIGIYETGDRIPTSGNAVGMEGFKYISSKYFNLKLRSTNMMCTKNYLQSIRPSEQQNDNGHWHKTWKMV